MYAQKMLGTKGELVVGQRVKYNKIIIMILIKWGKKNIEIKTAKRITNTHHSENVQEDYVKKCARFCSFAPFRPYCSLIRSCYLAALFAFGREMVNG